MAHTKEQTALINKYLHSFVEVVKDNSFGKTDVEVKDTGIVTAVDIHHDDIILTVDISPAKDFKGLAGWICKLEDVKILDKKAVANKEVEQKVVNYIAFVRGKEKEYKKQIDSAYKDISIKQNEIRDTYHRLNELNTLKLSSYNKAKRIEKSKIINGIQELEDKYEAIESSSDRIIARTKPIILEYNGLDIPLGRYAVEIDIMGNVVFSVVDRVNEPHEEVSEIHPHITASGSPCWGTWLQSITEGLTSGNYLSVLSLIHSYLSQCDELGWYVSALAFGKDANKRCKECWALVDECDCDKCEECGRDEEHCDCTRCPDSGDRIEEVGGSYCNGCSSLDNDGVCDF